MKLYTSDNAELMEVSQITTDGPTLIIGGTIMGAMPVEAILTAAELRKIFSLLSFKTILVAIRMMFSR